MGFRPHVFGIIRPELVVAAEAKIGLEGRFTVELIHARTGLVKQRLHFRNLIVDDALNAIGAGGNPINSMLQYLAVGTGNAEPSAADVALVSELARTNSNGGFPDSAGYVGGAEPYWWLKRNRVFTESEANGNLTELGFFRNSSGAPMFNRQLFRDINGDPVTVVKTSQDQLRIELEFRIYPPVVDVDQNFEVDGISTALKTRAYDIDDNDRWGARTVSGGSAVGYLLGLGEWQNARAGFAIESDVLPSSLEGSLGGTAVQANTGFHLPYTNGSFFRDFELRWEPSVANFATGIGVVTWGVTRVSAADAHNVEKWVTRFTPKVLKTDSKRFTFVGRVSFARRP